MKIKKIKPLFQQVVVTARKYAVDELAAEGIIDPAKAAGTLKEYQTVVAVGDFVKNIKVGDLVCINPDNYAVRKFSENSMKKDLMTNDVVRYNFNLVELDGVIHIILTDRDIRYVVEEYEEDTPSPIVDATPSIIFK